MKKLPRILSCIVVGSLLFVFCVGAGNTGENGWFKDDNGRPYRENASGCALEKRLYYDNVKTWDDLVVMGEVAASDPNTENPSAAGDETQSKETDSAQDQSDKTQPGESQSTDSTSSNSQSGNTQQPQDSSSKPSEAASSVTLEEIVGSYYGTFQDGTKGEVAFFELKDGKLCSPDIVWNYDPKTCTATYKMESGEYHMSFTCVFSKENGKIRLDGTETGNVGGGGTYKYTAYKQ